MVLATSIAETSLTIEDVRVVVDAGRARRARFDPGTGMSRLVTERVSRAEADQRRGPRRPGGAGRLLPDVDQGRGGRAARLPAGRDRGGRPRAAGAGTGALGRGRRRGARLPDAAATRACSARRGRCSRASARSTRQGRITAARQAPRRACRCTRGSATCWSLAGPGRGAARGAAWRSAIRCRAARRSTSSCGSRRWPIRAGSARDARGRAEPRRRRPDPHRGEAAGPARGRRRRAFARPDGGARLSRPGRAAAHGRRAALRAVGRQGRGARRGRPARRAAADRGHRYRRRPARGAGSGWRPRSPRPSCARCYGDRDRLGDVCDWSRREGRVVAREQERFGALVLDDRVWRDADPEAVARAMLDGRAPAGPAARPTPPAGSWRGSSWCAPRGADLPEMTEPALMDEARGLAAAASRGRAQAAADWKRFDILERAARPARLGPDAGAGPRRAGAFHHADGAQGADRLWRARCPRSRSGCRRCSA